MGSGQARGGARRSARGLGRGGSPSVAGAGTPAAGICARYKWGVGRPARAGWVAGRSHSGGWLRRSEYFWTHSSGQERPAGPKKARAKGSYMWVALVWVAWPCARRAWMMGPPKKSRLQTWWWPASRPKGRACERKLHVGRVSSGRVAVRAFKAFDHTFDFRPIRRRRYVRLSHRSTGGTDGSACIISTPLPALWAHKSRRGR